MYHYIRNSSTKFPNFNFLDKKQFINQISKYKKKIIKNKDDTLIFNNKILLTFDDGLKDHYFAAKELKKRKLIGVFFIPTKPYKSKDLLDVHKAHLILGKVGGKKALTELKNFVQKKKITNLINIKEKKFFKSRYYQQDDLHDVKEFKKIINYHGNLNYKKKILNYLIKIFKISINTRNFYLTKKEIKEMSNMGMIIGSHGESHILLSRLSYKKQYDELSISKIILEKITNDKCDFFCFPYGRKNSYNNDTLKILKNLNYKFSYSVEDRNIKKKDFQNNPFEMPRFDCNSFI